MSDGVSMKILDALLIDYINVDLKATDKNGVLEELAAPVAAATGAGLDQLVKVLKEREQLGSTGIGGGIGIPHGKLKQMPLIAVAFGVSRKGIDFDSMDGRPTHLFFLLLTPESSAGIHLKILARISRLLKNEDLKKRLLKADTPQAVLDVIHEDDEDF
jgi:PTS system nitrogen regulatory IIA component